MHGNEVKKMATTKLPRISTIGQKVFAGSIHNFVAGVGVRKAIVCFRRPPRESYSPMGVPDFEAWKEHEEKMKNSIITEFKEHEDLSDVEFHKGTVVQDEDSKIHEINFDIPVDDKNNDGKIHLWSVACAVREAASQQEMLEKILIKYKDMQGKEKQINFQQLREKIAEIVSK